MPPKRKAEEQAAAVPAVAAVGDVVVEFWYVFLDARVKHG